MSVIRINQFEANPGSEAAMLAFFRSITPIISACAGCVSVRVLESLNQPANLAVIEEWESVEVHQQAAKAIPPELMSTAMGLFAKPPAGAYYKA
jgi:quinol monooxygenase YgiN